MDSSFTRVLGIRGKNISWLDVSDQIESGFKPETLDRVKTLFAMSDRQLSHLLGVSLKTVGRSRQASGGRLSPGMSDRLFRLARLFAFAEAVLGDEDAARSWMRHEQIGLNNRIPLELLSTEAGAREVETLLGRIDYGVLI